MIISSHAGRDSVFRNSALVAIATTRCTGRLAEYLRHWSFDRILDLVRLMVSMLCSRTPGFVSVAGTSRGFFPSLRGSCTEKFYCELRGAFLLTRPTRKHSRLLSLGLTGNTVAMAGTRPSYESVSLSENVEVFIRPVRSDNFSYLIWEKSANVCAVVDPFSPRGLVDLAKSLGAPITTSLTTHRHDDHSGGNLELATLVPGVEIVGSTYENVPGATLQMSDGETLTLRGGSLTFKALHTPCHTNGHLCFVTETDTPAVFSGDTLFVGGCGRFFEGDGKAMEHSLNKVLASLPDNCLVLCGHEYTVSNLRFAAAIDGNNEAVKRKLEWASGQIASNLHTIPSTIGEEKTYNPFMRTSDRTMKLDVDLPDATAAEVMTAIRAKKDKF